MDMRGLKLSVVLIFLFYLLSCGGGTGGDANKTSISLFIELPEEFFTEPTSELSSEQESISRVLQPNFNGAVIELMVTGDFPTIKETIPVSTEGPTTVTLLLFPILNIFEAKFIDGDGILMAICKQEADIGETTVVLIPCSAFVCTQCDDPICEGEMCDLDDNTKECIDGNCITPTPSPTPIPPPTPAPTPTPTPIPILGCCDFRQTCANSTNLQCAEMQGFFFPGAMCFANGCSTTPPTPAPTPTPTPTPIPTPTPTPTPAPTPTPEPEVCCNFIEGCGVIPESECGGFFCAAPCPTFCCSD